VIRPADMTSLVDTGRTVAARLAHWGRIEVGLC
jgi:hypothetical protein